ncbi:MAG: hypothetical protein AB1486_14030 [Planctomycetota bacterium]
MTVDLHLQERERLQVGVSKYLVRRADARSPFDSGTRLADRFVEQPLVAKIGSGSLAQV